MEANGRCLSPPKAILNSDYKIIGFQLGAGWCLRGVICSAENGLKNKKQTEALFANRGPETRIEAGYRYLPNFTVAPAGS